MLRFLLGRRHRLIKSLILFGVLLIILDYFFVLPQTKRERLLPSLEEIQGHVLQHHDQEAPIRHQAEGPLAKEDINQIDAKYGKNLIRLKGPFWDGRPAEVRLPKIKRDSDFVEKDSAKEGETGIEKSRDLQDNKNSSKEIIDVPEKPPLAPPDTIQDIVEKLGNDGPVAPMVKLPDVNCAALFANDIVEMTKAEKVNRLRMAEEDYITMTSNCTDFLWRRRYTLRPVSEEEEQWPIAFSLLMFHDVERAERLLRAVYRPQNVYCVHVDMKSTTNTYLAMRGIVDCLPNVFMAETRIEVRWGKFSIIEPELICMQQLWAHPVKWKYFINLTGQEFPLKTNLQLVKIMKALNGANNMEGTVKRKNIPRTKYRWVNGKNTMELLGPAPYNITVTKGSVHILVQRGYVDFLLHNHMAQEFVNWTRFTDVPDETMFSSLNFSPQIGVPGAYIGEPETDLDTNPFIVRFKNWMTGIFREPCGGRWVRTVCIFGVRDLPALGIKRQLIANKFHSTYQPVAYECMEELHYNRTRAEINGHTYFNTTYYSTRAFANSHVS